jgi:hypothetical protein
MSFEAVQAVEYQAQQQAIKDLMRTVGRHA